MPEPWQMIPMDVMDKLKKKAVAKKWALEQRTLLAKSWGDEQRKNLKSLRTQPEQFPDVEPEPPPAPPELPPVAPVGQPPLQFGPQQPLVEQPPVQQFGPQPPTPEMPVEQFGPQIPADLSYQPPMPAPLPMPESGQVSPTIQSNIPPVDENRAAMAKQWGDEQRAKLSA